MPILSSLFYLNFNIVQIRNSISLCRKLNNKQIVLMQNFTNVDELDKESFKFLYDFLIYSLIVKELG